MYTISELQKIIPEKVEGVYQVFKDFFGEDVVDLQQLVTPQRIQETAVVLFGQKQEFSDVDLAGMLTAIEQNQGYPFILVYWPSVTVTNENDRSVVIQDLYAKVHLTYNGTIPYEYEGFSLNRATFENEVLLIDSYIRFLEISSKLIDEAPGMILFPCIRYFLILSLS